MTTFASLAYQTSTTTGASDLTVSSSTSTGWRTLAGAFGTGTGNKFRYAIRHQSAAEWETGIGYMSSSTVFVRDTVIASSNANAAVSFSAGTKEISADATADAFSLFTAASDKIMPATVTTLGYDTVGGSTETMTQYRVYMKKITLPSAGWIESVGAYISGTAGNNVQNLNAAVFTDNSGAPLRVVGPVITPALSLLPMSTSGTPTARWVDLGTRYYASAAGDYWVGVQNTSAAPGPIYYDGSGSDRYYTAGGAWFSDAGFTSVTTGSNKYSIRARFTPAG